MGDVLIILWLPLTIAIMAVAFVVTLGAVGGASAAEAGGLARSGAGATDDRAL